MLSITFSGRIAYLMLHKQTPTDLREPRRKRLLDHAGEDGGRLGRAEVGQEGALNVLHRVHRHARDAGRGHLNEEDRMRGRKRSVRISEPSTVAVIDMSCTIELSIDCR